MVESKSRLLYILKYLWQNTDAKHYATTADILSRCGYAAKIKQRTENLTVNEKAE